MTSRPPPLYRQRRFWALAIPCAFTLGMLIFAIEHLIRDPNEVGQRSSTPALDLVSCSVRVRRVHVICSRTLNPLCSKSKPVQPQALDAQQIISGILCRSTIPPYHSETSACISLPVCHCEAVSS